MNTTPKSHLYRLLLIIIVFLVAFITIKEWAAPASWNYQGWYRGDALTDVAAQPLIYGGNQSCQSCHPAAIKKLRKFTHRALSCESCHGALADHVRLKKKIAAAVVDKTRPQCLNCHSEQINRPKGFPMYSVKGEIGKRVRKHGDEGLKASCLKCHDAHDPTP